MQNMTRNHVEDAEEDKPVRKQSCRKDKPEPHTEQGKRKEVLCQQAEMLPPINVSRDSDVE